NRMLWLVAAPIGHHLGDARERARGAGVAHWQVQGEGAALAGRADQPDLTAEQGRQFAADGESQTGAAVLATGTRIGLLEGFEDQALLFGSDANARVGDFDGDGALDKTQNRVIGRPAARDRLDAHRDLTVRSELEGVRQQVL